MAVFVVTWNLNREAANYDARRTALLNQIGRYQNTSDPGLESVRWIAADNAEALCADLRQRLDNNDRIFVAQLIRSSYQGYLSQTVWDWINPRI